MTTTGTVGQPAADTDDITPTLRVRDLSVRFPSEAGAVHALRGVSFDVMPGEVLGIVGESGSGKSTVALSVMGLLPQSAAVTGSALFKGDEVLGLNDKELSRIRGDDIAMVFQDPLSAFTPVYTIGDQIAEAVLVHRDVSKRDARKRAVELLDLVGIPQAKDRATSFPHEFSGGMRQRAMIAMAIANDPDLILADEPTTALDVTVQAQILEVLDAARRETGAALVLITHDLGVVAGIADRVAVMYAGRIVETSSADALYAAPRMPYTIGLLGAIPRIDSRTDAPLVPIDGAPPSMVDLPKSCPFLPRCPISVDECEDVEPGLVEVRVEGGALESEVHLSACHRAPRIDGGRIDGMPVFPIPDLPPIERDERPRDDVPIVLEVENLERQYTLRKGAVFRRQIGTVHAVDGISFELRAGEALAIVGESGCGKTSAITEILELRAPSAGRVVVFGEDTATMTPADKQRIRRDVQVVFQDPLASLDPRLPVGDIVGEPLLTYGVKTTERRARVARLLRQVGLEPSHANRYPSEFSGGQRQRIAIARALALDPRLIVLDEPVSALDVSIQAGVLNLLAQLRAELSLSYLFVAHDLAVVRHTADRVAVMYLGRIVEIGSVDEVFDHPQHPYTQALLSAIPLPDPTLERSRERIVLVGDLPSSSNPPSGCRFRTRCWKARDICAEESPALMVHEGDDHEVACHFAEPRSVV